MDEEWREKREKTVKMSAKSKRGPTTRPSQGMNILLHTKARLGGSPLSGLCGGARPDRSCATLLDVASFLQAQPFMGGGCLARRASRVGGARPVHAPAWGRGQRRVAGRSCARKLQCSAARAARSPAAAQESLSFAACAAARGNARQRARRAGGAEEAAPRLKFCTDTHTHTSESKYRLNGTARYEIRSHFQIRNRED